MGLLDTGLSVLSGGGWNVAKSQYKAATGDLGGSAGTLLGGPIYDEWGNYVGEAPPGVEPLPGSEEELQRQRERLAGRQRAAQGLVESYRARPEQMAVANRQAAARALAAGLSQGGITGGASLAAAQQSALDLEGKQADELARAEIDAAQAEYEQFLDENDPGSVTSGQQQALADFQNSLPTDFSGDEEAFVNDKLEEIRREPDPELRQRKVGMLRSWYYNQTTAVGRNLPGGEADINWDVR